MTRALELAAAEGVTSIAFSALGTGEGRVKPDVCARHMLGGVRDFQTKSRFAVETAFSLPSDRDFTAFQAALTRGGDGL
ncbi:MAG: hypothetical protein KIT58_07410 [Planctomycetota bacterium]|nr:hypothetical protein [Planctomycetota bacterium]